MSGVQIANVDESLRHRLARRGGSPTVGGGRTVRSEVEAVHLDCEVTIVETPDLANLDAVVIHQPVTSMLRDVEHGQIPDAARYSSIAA